MRLSWSRKRYATLTSAHAPTITNPDDIKDKLFDDLEQVISKVPSKDKLIVPGDFKARVGSDHQTWKGITRKHVVGKRNTNGLLLLRLRE